MLLKLTLTSDQNTPRKPANSMPSIDMDDISRGSKQCDDAITKTVIVIDKSASLPPTLEHHLAMHLWMGWMGFYALFIFFVAVSGPLLSLNHYRSTFSALELNPAFAGNIGKFGDFNSAGDRTCSFNSSWLQYNTVTGVAAVNILKMSPYSFSSILQFSRAFFFWTAVVCGSFVFLTVIVSAIAPLNRHDNPNPRWCLSVGNWIMRKGSEYFKLRVVLEDYEAMRLSGESGKPAIFVLEPHDVLPVSIFSLCDFLGALPGKRRLIGCISSACFRVPLMRHVWSWVCAESVDKSNVVSLLKRGVSVCLCPGGVREVICMSEQQVRRSRQLRSVAQKGINLKNTSNSIQEMSSSVQSFFASQGDEIHQETLILEETDKTGPSNDIIHCTTHRNIENVMEKREDVVEEEECVLYLRARKGFVRLALQHNCPLVPMFTFGQREVLVPWFCTNRCVRTYLRT